MDANSLLIGVAIGVVGMTYPIILEVIFLGSIFLFMTGRWDSFWRRFQGPKTFRPAKPDEMKRLANQLALVDNTPIAKMVDNLKDATVGVSEYRGASGPFKLFAIGFHGSDTLQVFFRENMDGNLELTGWTAAKAEKR